MEGYLDIVQIQISSARLTPVSQRASISREDHCCECDLDEWSNEEPSFLTEAASNLDKVGDISDIELLEPARLHQSETCSMQIDGQIEPENDDIGLATGELDSISTDLGIRWIGKHIFQRKRCKRACPLAWLMEPVSMLLTALRRKSKLKQNLT